MKLFKKLFGSNLKEISKYEPNTLAEINESPDMRKNDADEADHIDTTEKAKVASKPQKVSANTSKSSTVKSSAAKKNSNVKGAKKDKVAPSNSTKPTAKATKKAPVEFDNEIKFVTTSIDNEALTGSKEVGKALSKKLLADVKNQAKAPEKESPKNNKPVAKATAKKPVADKKTPAKDTKKSSTEAEPTSAESKSTAKNITKAASSKPTNKVSSKDAVADAKTQTKTIAKKSENENKSSTDTNKKDATETKTASAKKAITSTTPANKTTSKAKEKTPANIDTDNAGIDEIAEVKTTRTGKFEIKKSKDGRYVFNLYASNNVIVATSQIYSSSSSALNGIKSVVANASSAPIEDQTVKNYTAVPFPKWEIYKDKGEQFRFRLSASNGSCVCHSQGYTSKTNCKKGIESIIKFATDAEIIKSYINKEK